MKEVIRKNKLTIFAIFIIIYFCIVYIIDNKGIINHYQSIGALAILFIIVITSFSLIKQYKENKKIDSKKIILAIILIGIILRTVYILYTPITERQHDVEGNYGHLEYIETIYETGRLPTSNLWQFYQQPLHHIIAAGWLKINEFFGVDLVTAEEGIQILTAIYSSLIMLIIYCILKELNVKNSLKIIVMLLISVHPTFIILSGSINNDILVIMLTFLGLLYLIKWYKNSSLRNTIILAIITAFIALTKIVGTIIALPILYIFFDKFFNDCSKEENSEIIKKYIFKFIIFGIIALGLGLSYSIRNMVLFGQNIFAVPLPGDSLYCGDSTLLDRFNIFSGEWKTIFCNPFEDCNIIVFLIKCSLFGEYSLENTAGMIMAILMIIANVGIIIVSLISLCKILRKKEKSVILNMFIVFYFSQIIMYMFSNISIPYGCTMDFRYIVPTIYFGIMFIIENIKNEPKLYGEIVNGLVIVFAITSVIFELTYMPLLSL